jgi:hypothetical protein
MTGFWVAGPILGPKEAEYVLQRTWGSTRVLWSIEHGTLTH